VLPPVMCGQSLVRGKCLSLRSLKTKQIGMDDRPGNLRCSRYGNLRGSRFGVRGSMLVGIGVYANSFYSNFESLTSNFEKDFELQESP
jgi:hypothetical protein